MAREGAREGKRWRATPEGREKQSERAKRWLATPEGREKKRKAQRRSDEKRKLAKHFDYLMKSLAEQEAAGIQLDPEREVVRP